MFLIFIYLKLMQHADLLDSSEDVFNGQTSLGSGIVCLALISIHEILLALTTETRTIITNSPSSIIIHPLDYSLHCRSIQVEEAFDQVSINETPAWTHAAIGFIVAMALVA